MTTYDEEPLDLAAVSADDALVERLRRSLSPEAAVVWDDDDDAGEDRSYALLRALQLDITAEAAPAAPVLSDLVADVVPLTGRRRALGRSATVAAVTAGVLALGGAAAAATSAPGDPMYGVRSAVASAVQEVVDAITPAAPVGPALSAAATPTATITPPGRAVSTTARSISAVRQIEERLYTAQRLLDAGRPKPALEVLDQATRRLPLVTDLAVRSALAGQVADLRAAAAAAMTPPPVRPEKPRDDDAKPSKDDRRPSPKATRAPAATRPATGGASTGRSEGAGKTRILPELPAAAQPNGRAEAADR